MGDAPDIREQEDCPTAEACDRSCDQHMPTDTETLAEVLAAHQWHHTRDTHCACGFRTPLAQLAVEGYIAHVAALIEAHFTARIVQARAGEGALREALAKWTGCWCGEQQHPDHDPRVRDCPQHGSDDCRHMAEGIATDLRAALTAADPS